MRIFLLHNLKTKYTMQYTQKMGLDIEKNLKTRIAVYQFINFLYKTTFLLRYQDSDQSTV